MSKKYLSTDLFNIICKWCALASKICKLFLTFFFLHKLLDSVNQYVFQMYMIFYFFILKK